MIENVPPRAIKCMQIRDLDPLRLFVRLLIRAKQ